MANLKGMDRVNQSFGELNQRLSDLQQKVSKNLAPSEQQALNELVGKVKNLEAAVKQVSLNYNASQAQQAKESPSVPSNVGAKASAVHSIEGVAQQKPEVKQQNPSQVNTGQIK